jgi:hypothetical protein
MTSRMRLAFATPRCDSNERTNERTNAESFSPTDDTSSSVTRTRTYGDFPDWSQP